MENTDTSESLLEALSAAEDALSRLDERVRLCAFRLGWAARQDIAEAVAWSWTGGSIVPLHDLILHDENMDVRMPDEALRAAHGVVRARRKAAAGGAELLTPEGAAWLAGRRNRAPSPSRVERAPNAASAGGGAMLDTLVQALDRLRSGVTESRDEAVGEWLGLLSSDGGRAPAVLRAAAALEGWRIIDPFPRQSYLGPILVACWLRERRRVGSHLLGLEGGYRSIMRRARPSPHLSAAERIIFWLGVLGESATQAGEALNQLELARHVAALRAGGRRAHSHLTDLVGLMLERPVVTGPLIAERLKVTPQTARRLVGELGGSVTEISGQKRYRAWRLG